MLCASAQSLVSNRLRGGWGAQPQSARGPGGTSQVSWLHSPVDREGLLARFAGFASPVSPFIGPSRAYVARLPALGPSA